MSHSQRIGLWLAIVSVLLHLTWGAATPATATTVKMMIRPVADWALCNNGPDDHPVWPPAQSSTTKRENMCANPQDLIKGKPVPCDLREFPSRTDQHSNVTATLVDEANARFPLPHGCFEFVMFLSYPAETHSMAHAFSSPFLHPDAETDVDAASRGRSHAHPASPAATKDMQQLFRSMVQVVDRLDRDYHLRRLRVVYPAHDYEAMAQLLDALLTPRLWLALRAETFPFPFSRVSTAFRSVSGDAKATYLSSVVDKYHHDLEAALRLHATIAYPDADTCTRRTGLMVSRHFCTHPGWAGVLGMYKYQQSHFTYANMAVYVSESNGPHEVTAFDGGLGSTCTLRNRWHCAFLPSTSCAMPAEVTACRTERCVSSVPETHFFAAMYWHGAFVPPPADYEVITNLSRALSQPLTAQQYLWRRILSNDFRSLEALGDATATATAATATAANAAGGNELRIAYVDMGDASPLAQHFVTPTDASSQMWRPAAEVADRIAAARDAAAAKPPPKASLAGANAAAVKPKLSTVLPGVSSPENLGRLQYRLPSPQRQFARWPTPRSEQENPQRRYEPVEIQPQDVVVQAAYLLRHNHRYRAFLAHAQRHFLDLHALQDHLDAAHRGAGDAASASASAAAAHGLDFNVDAAATAALLSDAEDDRLAKLFAALTTPQPAKPHRRLRSAPTGGGATVATAAAPTLPRCVAVQLRRGDRVLSSLLPNKGPAAGNAAAAANATDEEARRAQQKYQEYCAQHPEGDFGCRSVPFAFVSLLNVTEVAHTLVDPDEVSHLVVSTDDEGWLQEQVALLQRHAPQWQVHYLPAPWLSHFNVTDLSSSSATASAAAHDHLNASELLPHGPDAAHYATPTHHQHRHKAHVVDKSEAEEQFKKYGRRGLAGGIHFFASMQLLQQCEAFVGHFDSGVAWMMYTAMCHRHRGLVAVCPPVFDLRHLQEFHKVYGHLYHT